MARCKCTDPKLKRFRVYTLTIDRAREHLESLKQQYLTERGWTYSSDTPGSIWLFSKKLRDGRTIVCRADDAMGMQEWVDYLHKKGEKWE